MKNISLKLKIAAAAVCLLAVVAAVGLIPRVTGINVTGNRYYTAAEISDGILSGNIMDAPLVMLVRSLTGLKPELMGVDSYTMSLTGLTTADVTVKEKAFMGYVGFLGSNLYFDRDGVILKSTREHFEGIPEIKGLDFSSAVLGGRLPVTRDALLLEVLQISQYLAAEKVRWGDADVPLSTLVDTITFDSTENISCMVDDILILLGAGENLEGKLHEMSDILPNLQGRSGILHLESYDPVNGNSMYRFE